MKRLLVILFLFLSPFYVIAKDWYVDNNAIGINTGTSWPDAWESFADIFWGSINPGDTIYISGGSSSKTYNEQLSVGASGVFGSPITISVGQDGGHNGQVIITHTSYGINISGKSYITINGNYGGKKNIYVYNCDSDGIQITGTTVNNIILTYLEVGWNGNGNEEDGINIDVNNYSYPILEISYCSIHDNYQDNIYSNRPDHSIRATNYRAVIVHHNDIYNQSDDGFPAACGGIDFYENTVHGRNLQGVGHADGIQFLGGDYTRIYNNTFYDLVNGTSDTNSYIFVDPYSSTSRAIANLKIYNNLIYETKTAAGNEYLRGIAFKAEFGINNVSDVLIANNTIVGVPAWGMTLTFNGLGSSNVSNVRVLNNVFYGCAQMGGPQMIQIGNGGYTVGSDGDGADVTIDYNSAHAGSGGNTNVNYKGPVYSYANFKSTTGCQDNDVTADPSLDANYKPDNVGDPVVDAGFDLSFYFTTDKEGVIRPPIEWDIGAYEFGSGHQINSPTGLHIVE